MEYGVLTTLCLGCFGIMELFFSRYHILCNFMSMSAILLILCLLQYSRPEVINDSYGAQSPHLPLRTKLDNNSPTKAIGLCLTAKSNNANCFCNAQETWIRYKSHPQPACSISTSTDAPRFFWMPINIHNTERALNFMSLENFHGDDCRIFH